MQIVIRDLTEEDFARIFAGQLGDIHVIANNGEIHHCLGCFGCWTKTPGACMIRDAYGDLGALLAKCSQVLIISKCCYGGFSPFVKNVLDRSIPYIHPYFVNRHGEMHHRRRYDNHVNLQVWFYGETTERERDIARELVKANAINLWWDVSSVSFSRTVDELGGQGL